MQPDKATLEAGISIQGPDGTPQAVRLIALEDALSPTLLVWPNRDGVIVPISRNYADDLLGTAQQLPLFGSPEAAFVTRRTYFSSPRTASIMRPATPVLFYESLRSGGRGAIVAAARIVDAVIMQKEQVSGEHLRRAVVEDLDLLTSAAESSSQVSTISCDSRRWFPWTRSGNWVPNFQTATPIASGPLDAILELGWPRARRD